jgi:hypothetical protein
MNSILQQVKSWELPYRLQRNNFDEDNRPLELVDAITIIPIINLIMFPILGRNTKFWKRSSMDT